MKLALDETALVCDAIPAETVAVALETLADLLAEARKPRQSIVRFLDLYEFEVHGERTVAEMLFDPGFPVQLDLELRRRLQISFDRCVDWDPDAIGGDLDVTIGDASFFAPTIAFAHSRRTSGRRSETVGCLGSEQISGRAGLIRVLRAGVAANVHFVASTTGVRDAARTALDLDGLTAVEYFHAAPAAFPELDFVDGLALQVRRLDGGLSVNRTELTRHLAALNDHHVAAFDGHPAPNEIIARMKALGNIDMSPESPQTRANRAAWNQRRVEHGGTEVYCDWHLKMSPTVNRIHFHPARPGVSNRPLVGTIHAHLSL